MNVVSLNNRRLKFKLDGVIACRNQACDNLAWIIEACNTKEDWDINFPVIRTYQEAITNYGKIIADILEDMQSEKKG